MSSTTYSPTAGGIGARGSIEPLAAIAEQVRAVTAAVGELTRTAADAQAATARRTLASLGLSLPQLHRPSACALPKCKCPPPDLGQVTRTIERDERSGANAVIAVRLRNRTKKRRTYRLAAEPLQSDDGQQGSAIQLDPASVELEAGAVALVRLQADLADHRDLLPYHSRLKVSSVGCEEMSLGVTVIIAPAVMTAPLVDLHCCCQPNVRPLRWYHHYYCDPPQPRPQGPGDIVNPGHQ